jgi:CubicO group peptidase (beta-lactamase class C family)
LAVALLVAACSGTAPSDSATRAGSSASPTTAEEKLAGAIAQQLKSGPEYSAVRAILVTVKGRTVFEKYYSTTAGEYRNAYSVTKSVMSTLIGIAVGEGRLRLDDTLAELLPAYAARMTPVVARITLRQVLTMTAGFPGAIDDAALGFTTTPDWVADILQHQSGTPGQWFAYSNGGSHLLSAILVNATGMPVLQYARARLFDPLGIVTRPALEPRYDVAGSMDAYLAAGFAWTVDPQRRHTGFTGLKLRPREMVKLGMLFLDGGRWEGRQVVPAAWVRDATSRHVATPPAHPAEGYGYQWWVTTIGNDPAFFALGTGGQLIEVVPGLGLVVVISTEVDEEHPAGPSFMGQLLSYMVRGVIVPAVR